MHFPFVTPDTFGKILIVETHEMMRKIAEKELRLAENNAWGPATSTWAYMLSKGAKDLSPEQFNPFIINRKSGNNTGKIGNISGTKLPWMSKATALGIIEAAEKKILPANFWVQLSGIWLDILATSE